MFRHGGSSKLHSQSLRVKIAVIAASSIAVVTTAAGPATTAHAEWGNDPAPTPTIYVKPKADADALPNVLAQTWVVADADTGQILAGRDHNRRMPPASTLKTLTALTLLPRLQLDSTYNATNQDWGTEGAKVGVEVGAPYKVEDLFNGLLLPSGNDAASALANAYGGWAPTVAAMNAEAKRLHLSETTAKNPSGLDETGQLSSAADLATIMREGLKQERFHDFITRRSAPFPNKMPTDPKAQRGTITIYTENRLLLNNDEGAIGGKTGFTSQAGRTYVGAMQRGGRTLIVAIMHCSTRTSNAARWLLNWGFNNADKVTPVGTLPTADPAPSITPQPAALLTPDGQLVNPDAGTPATRIAANAKSISTTSGESGGGVSLLAIFFWFIVAVVAVLAGLRIRAVRRIKKRRAQRGGNPQPSAPQWPPPPSGPPIDLRAQQESAHDAPDSKPTSS